MLRKKLPIFVTKLQLKLLLLWNAIAVREDPSQMRWPRET